MPSYLLPKLLELDSTIRNSSISEQLYARNSVSAFIVSIPMFGGRHEEIHGYSIAACHLITPVKLGIGSTCSKNCSLCRQIIACQPTSRARSSHHPSVAHQDQECSNNSRVVGRWRSAFVGIQPQCSQQRDRKRLGTADSDCQNAAGRHHTRSTHGTRVTGRNLRQRCRNRTTTIAQSRKLST
jgi:hypothetical protein